MKKIMIGVIMQESNTFTKRITKIDDFAIYLGNEMIDHIPSVVDIFKSNGFEIVPTIFAVSSPGGKVSKEAFKYFQKVITDKLNKEKIDGIWLHLHGAMTVEGIGSGEKVLIENIRNIVGNNIPISLALDLHGNISKSLVDNSNIICGYKTAPHIDAKETEIRAAKALIDCFYMDSLPKTYMIDIPLLLFGEQATTGVEPTKSVISKLNNLEKFQNVISANFFCGMAWVDSSNTSVSLVVSCKKITTEIVNETNKIANFIWKSKEKFALEEKALSAIEATKEALKFKEGIVFITDTGDNITAGAIGDNNEYLITLLEHFSKVDKKILVAGIYDANIDKKIKNVSIGKTLEFAIGGCENNDVKPHVVNCKLLEKGVGLSSQNQLNNNYALLSISNINVLITKKRTAFGAINLFDSMHINIDDFHIIIVKQGYLFDQLRKKAKMSYIALTHGSSSLDINSFEFVNLKRPIFPIDSNVKFQL